MKELDISNENCTIQQKDHILIVTLNRPEAKNALSPSMLVGMYRAWRLLDEDNDLYCAVLTGKGDTFCAGMDLKAGTDGGQGSDEIQEIMQSVPNLAWQALLRDNQPKKPIIIAIEGYALAGGTEILQGTDIRVCAEDATLGVTEVIRGLYPMAGSTIRLRRQIPYCRAAEMLLLGEHITPQDALSWGLINRIVPKGEALNEALKLAEKLCENAPLSIMAITKSLRDHQENLSEEEALNLSDSVGWPVIGSEDAREGMKAFKEKRKPIFKGK